MLDPSELSEVLLSKNNIDLSPNAKEQLQFTIDYLKKKYPNK
jgi:hypothetical protein